MTDSVQLTLDVVAFGAVVAFSSLCVVLAAGLKDSALRRGFVLAASAGFIHSAGNTLNILGDLAILGSNVPSLTFSIIQAVFMILLAAAVRSFFPSWYRAFKKTAKTP